MPSPGLPALFYCHCVSLDLKEISVKIPSLHV